MNEQRKKRTSRVVVFIFVYLNVKTQLKRFMLYKREKSIPQTKTVKKVTSRKRSQHARKKKEALND